MMTETENKSSVNPPSVVFRFPFDVIKMIGNESVDFLQRIATNEFNNFVSGNIQKTLLVTDKGRIIDTVWVIHQNDHLLMLTSHEMAGEIIAWLNKYIVMEDILLSDVSSEFDIDVHFDRTENFYKTDYFGFPVSIELKPRSILASSKSVESYELWRIENGIPKTKKEITQEHNPLELNLWDWISFTKGCYIGQEVIARLDTYNKIQRVLCKISSNTVFSEQELLIDERGVEAGKITSVFQTGETYSGLAVLRVKFAVAHQQLTTKETKAIVKIEKTFRKDVYGRD